MEAQPGFRNSVQSRVFYEMVLAVENTRSLPGPSGLSTADELLGLFYTLNHEQEENIIRVRNATP